MGSGLGGEEPIQLAAEGGIGGVAELAEQGKHPGGARAFGHTSDRRKVVASEAKAIKDAKIEPQ